MTSVLLALLGCAPRVEYIDHHTQMDAVCQWAAYREAHADAASALELPSNADGVAIPPYPSTECAEQVLADLSVDEAAFSQEERDDALKVATSPGMAGLHGILSGPLAGVRAMALYGDSPRDGESALVSASFTRELDRVAAETGATTLGATVYDFVTSTIQRTAPGEGEEDAPASFDPTTRTLALATPWDQDDGGALNILVHEARHVYATHEACPVGDERTCDPDLDGPFGFGLAAVTLTVPAYTSLTARDGLADAAWTDLRHIELASPDGSVSAEWSEAWSAAFEP